MSLSYTANNAENQVAANPQLSPSLLSRKLQQVANTPVHLRLNHSHHMDVDRSLLSPPPLHHFHSSPNSPIHFNGIVPPFGSPCSFNSNFNSLIMNMVPLTPVSPSGSCASSFNNNYALPSPPPNSLQSNQSAMQYYRYKPTPAPPSTPTSATSQQFLLPGLMQSLASLTTLGSTPPSPGLVNGMSSITLGNPQLRRRRRRSSLSVFSTYQSEPELTQLTPPSIVVSDAPDTGSEAPTPPQAAPTRRIGRPRTLTADASAAAAALLGSQGTVVALGATPYSDDDQKVRVCDQCGKLFRCDSALSNHQQVHGANTTATANLLLDATNKLAFLNKAGLGVCTPPLGSSSLESTAGPSSPAEIDDEMVFPMHDSEGPSSVA